MKISRRHVEDPLVLAQIHAFTEFFADQLQRVAGDGIIPARVIPVLARERRPMIDP